MEVECIIIDNETCDGDDNNITLEGEPNILPNSGEFCKIADKEVAKTNTAIKSVLLDPQYNQPDSTVTVQDTDAKEDDHPTNSNNATNLTNASNSISSIDDIASTLLCPVGCGAWLAECHMSRHVDQHFAQNTAVQQRDAKRGTPGSPTLLASKRPRMNGVGRKAVTKKQTKRTSWGALGSAKADLSVKDTSRGPRRTYPEVMMKSRKIGVHTLDSGKNNGINHGVNNGTDNGTVTFKHSEGAAISIGQVRNTGGNSNQHAENNNANSSSSKHRIDLNKHGIHHNTAAMSNLDNHTGQLRIGECDRVHSGRDVKTHAYNGNQPNRIHANGNNNGDKNRHHANNDTNSKTYIRNQNMTQNVSNAHPRTSATIQNTKPLAERMRPKDLDGFVGQLKSIGPSSALRVLLEKDRLPSLILWGGPGSGKTTLAKIISRMTAMHFAELSAVSSGISDIKRILSEAEGRRKLLNKPTILFIDEIHRFNKVQQDALLPHVERGLITLIGATTENPSFSCNAALLSRCRVVTFEQLTQDELLTILNRALDTANPKVENDSTTTAADTLQQEIDALTYIANIADGDARNGLNMLEVSLTSQSVRKEDATDTPVQLEGVTKTKQARITVETVQAAIQKTHFLYDRAGEGHYNTISALHKSLRGSDANAGIYWLTRMLAAGEDPLYVARRLIKFASEDVGIADPQALPQAIAAYDASAKIGMPECGVCLAQCVVYLAAAPKSVSVYRAYSMALQLNKTAPAYPVPFHLRNAPTKLMKDIGYKKGYLYNPDHTEEECAGQTYLPDELLGTQFYIPDEPPDPERTVSEQQEKIRDHIH